MDVSPRLFVDGRKNAGMRISQFIDRKPAKHVEIFGAVFSIQIDAIAAVNLERDPFVGMEQKLCFADCETRLITHDSSSIRFVSVYVSNIQGLDSGDAPNTPIPFDVER